MISKQEEIFWRQKSRSIWLKQGDNNTSFFHKMANAHHRYSHIDNLVINGRSVTDEESINNKILAFFKSLYSEDEPSKLPWSYPDCPRISMEDNLELQQPFLEEEILAVLKECEGDKAPGPDGFTMGFYKKCWSSHKKLFPYALHYFHEKEHFLRSLNAKSCGWLL